MAQLWCTGPCHVFVGSAGSAPAAALYFGCAESAPDAELRPSFDNVMADLGGQRVPTDRIYEGVDALVTVDFVRWNEAVLTAVEQAPGAARGLDDPGDIGTLMVQEQQVHVLYLQFPYAAKAAMLGMPPGYRFPAATLEGDTLHSLGTKVRKVRLVWHCVRTLDMTVANAYGKGRFLTYDNAVAGLPAID